MALLTPISLRWRPLGHTPPPKTAQDFQLVSLKLLAEELYNYTSLAEGAALSDGRAEKVNLLAAAGGSEAAPASQLPAEIGRIKARLYRALLRHRERPLSAVPVASGS